ncbi:NAD-dependent deacylase [bacterium]|nr:NAD-dependent deacylase [bacterium]
MESRYKRIVFLTGAGISSESGVRTFRDSQGLWEEHKVEEVASPQGFKRDPVLVWKFYSMRRIQANEVHPNKAHIALADALHNLEQSGCRTLLITQNVDTLHERAFGALPSKNFIDIHGTLSRSKCTKCQKVFSDRWCYFDGKSQPVQNHADNLWSHPGLQCLLSMPRRNAQGIPLSPCCSDLLRPDIVWFGEKPHGVEHAIEQLTTCDLFVSIGTSGNVYPAAGFATVARKAGAHTASINLEPTENSSAFHERIQGVASEKVPEFLKKIWQ